MTDNTQTVTLGDTTAMVEVPEIENEVTRLWAEAAEMGAPVLRACALNLVIYTSDQVDANTAAGIVDAITAEHPSRALVLIAKPNVASAITANVHAHCSVSGGARQICCEEIRIEAGGGSVAALPDVVLQLVAPETPVFLWWTGDPPLGSEDFNRLSRAADRVVIDSGCFSDPVEGLAREAALVTNSSFGTALGDLNWARLTHWRDLCAQFFDRIDFRRKLTELDRVEIEYEDGEHNPVLAQLYVGWLASRLGWHYKPSEAQNGTFHFLSDGKEVLATIHPVAPKSEARGSLVSVVLLAPGARFAINYDAESQCAECRAELEGKDAVQHKVPLEPRDLADLLGEELEIMGRDRIFEEALAVAARA